MLFKLVNRNSFLLQPIAFLSEIYNVILYFTFSFAFLPLVFQREH